MDKETRRNVIMLAYASSVGIAMVIAIFGCLFLGVYLDREFGTGYKFTVILLLIGIVAGFRNLYVIVKKYGHDEKPVITRLKSEPHRNRPPAKEA